MQSLLEVCVHQTCRGCKEPRLHKPFLEVCVHKRSKERLHKPTRAITQTSDFYTNLPERLQTSADYTNSKSDYTNLGFVTQTFKNDYTNLPGAITQTSRFVTQTSKEPITQTSKSDYTNLGFLYKPPRAITQTSADYTNLQERLHKPRPITQTFVTQTSQKRLHKPQPICNTNLQGTDYTNLEICYTSSPRTIV